MTNGCLFSKTFKAWICSLKFKNSLIWRARGNPVLLLTERKWNVFPETYNCLFKGRLQFDTC